MESRFDRRELLFQPRGIPPLGTSLSLRGTTAPPRKD